MSSRHIRGNLVFKGNYEHTIAGDVTAAMLANCSLLLVNKSSGAATAVALPAMQYVGQAVKIIDAKGDAGTNNITITPASGTINGAATYVISENYGAIELVWDGTNFTVSAQGLAVSAAELAFINGVTAGTGLASKALVLDSSGNVAMPTGGLLALSRATIAAAGSDATNATVLTGQVNAVTAADNAKGVALPAAATTTGPIWVINTVANASLLVYPVNGGNDNINGLAEDAAFILAPGQAACFTPTSATQWYVPDSAGVKAKELTATYSVTVAENGMTYYLNSGTEFATTLPAPFLGANYKFIVKAAPSGASYTVVTASSANIIKGLQNSAFGDAGDTGTADDTISFVDGQALAGDMVELFSDGTSWFAFARSRVAAGITFTQAS